MYSGFFCIKNEYNSGSTMTDREIKRINELASKKRNAVLTEAEAGEQRALRDKYRAEYRASFQNVLNNTYVLDANGKKEKLIK